MSGALPPRWRLGMLADVIASISTGVSVNGEDRPVREGEVGVLKITAVLRGVFEPEHHKAVVGPERNRLTTRVSAGTVLVSRGNGNPAFVGAAALVTKDHPNLYLPDLLWEVTPSRNVSPEWLGLVLGSTLMRPHIARIAVSTSTLKKISQSQYFTLPIVIPPRHEQDRIVEIVQTWDRGIEVGTALISARRRALEVARAKLVERAEADAAELSAFAVNTNRLVPVEDVARRSLPCIELEHMEEATGRILGQADTSQLRGTRRAFKPGDVLYGRLRPYLRKFAQAQAPGVCSTEVWVLSANLRMCAPGYLYQIVQTDRFNVEANKSSGSRMPRADWDALSRVEFSLPPIERQQRIVALLAAEEETLDLLTRVVEHLRHQRTVLMGRLLPGTLNVYPANTATREIATRETAEPAHA